MGCSRWDLSISHSEMPPLITSWKWRGPRLNTTVLCPLLPLAAWGALTCRSGNKMNVNKELTLCVFQASIASQLFTSVISIHLLIKELVVYLCEVLNNAASSACTYYFLSTGIYSVWAPIAHTHFSQEWF